MNNSEFAQPDLSKLVIKEDDFPTRFAVEVCADCNLSCSMCYHPNMQRPKGKMPFPLWQKCADEVAELASTTCECWFSFCGEPLMEPELLLRMLEYGRQVGLKSMNINTNGMLYRPELGEPLLDSGIQRIVFGVDGFSKESYERARVGGDRDRLYANVEDLLKKRQARDSGPDVIVQFIVMEENRHEVEDFQEYWLKRGAVVKVRHQLSWGGRVGTALDTPEDRVPCPWALTMMHVFWDGRVPRCPGDTEGQEGVGNAWDDSLQVLWARLGAYRDLHMQQRYNDLPNRCHECTDWMVGKADMIRKDPSTSHPGGLETDQ